MRIGLLVLGGLALGGVALGVYAAAQQTQTSPSGTTPKTPKACPLPPPGAVTGVPPKMLVASLSQTATTLNMNVGDTLRVNLLRSSGPWSATSDDESVLQLDRVTTGPDPSAPGGTDDVFFFRAVGPGAVRITGSAGGNFHVDAVVVCT